MCQPWMLIGLDCWANHRIKICGCGSYQKYIGAHTELLCKVRHMLSEPLSG